MATLIPSTLALFMCAAINAFPALGDELYAANDDTQLDSAELRRAVAVLTGQNSETFGDRDSRQELAVLTRWTGQTTTESKQPTMFQQLAARIPAAAERLVAELCVEPADTASDISKALEESWARSDAQKLCVPSMILSNGRRIPIQTMCKSSTVDFESCTDAQRACLKKAKTEVAQARVQALESVVGGIRQEDDTAGCAEIAESLFALKQWMESPAVNELADSGLSAPHDAVADALAKMDMWQNILGAVGAQEQGAKEALATLQRPATYVLRALLVEDTLAMADSPKRFSVVRRYGKTTGKSHYSVMGADGVCEPIRESDMRGMVVESLWVCCSLDSECRADQASGGINVVVADPDDEIFCKKCDWRDSIEGDRIVMCDSCNYGFHQLCHIPLVMDKDLEKEKWYCKDCTEAIEMSRPTKRQRIGGPRTDIEK